MQPEKSEAEAERQPTEVDPVGAKEYSRAMVEIREHRARAEQTG